MTDPRVLFFGVSAGERGGHFLRAPGALRHASESVLRRLLPPSIEYFDGAWCWPVPRTLEQLRRPNLSGSEAQGRGFVHYRDGWTIVSWWDRSADTRGGCCAVFLVEGRHRWAEAIAHARQVFPRELARMEAHYPVALAGADLPADGPVDAAEAFLADFRGGFRALHPEVQECVRALLRRELAAPLLEES